MKGKRGRVPWSQALQGLLQLRSYMRRVFGWAATAANYYHFLTSTHTHRDYTVEKGSHRWEVEIGTFLAAAPPWRDRVAWHCVAPSRITVVTVACEGRPETGEAKINRVYLTLKEK
jgi:hypothetical protein